MGNNKYADSLRIEMLPVTFSVCKVENYNLVDMEVPYVFTGCTDEEKSLVCPLECIPGNTTERDDGWTAMRIMGQMDFSLIGVLAEISRIMADAGIGIFAISTYNTDYILTKQENVEKAVSALKIAGYTVMR